MHCLTEIDSLKSLDDRPVTILGNRVLPLASLVNLLDPAYSIHFGPRTMKDDVCFWNLVTKESDGRVQI